MVASQPADTVSRLVSVVLVVAVVGSAVFGIVSVESLPVQAANSSTVEGTPHLNASAPSARLTPGESDTVGVSITNDATYNYNNDTHPEGAITRAGEARSVRVNLSDTRDAPLTVQTGAQSVGTIQDGETGGPYQYSVVVDDDAKAGTYTVDVTTTYRHAKRVSYDEVADGEYAYNETVVNRTETSTITVVIEPEADFEVASVSHDVPLGGEGTIDIWINNTGDRNVTESTVSLTSSDSNLAFGSGTATAEANVDTWNAGETKRLQFRASTSESAVEREYPVDVTVSYVDDENVQQTDSDQIGITPGYRNEFEILDVSHDVPRNGEGTMTVTVEHTAEKPLTDVSVTATTGESEVYLGSQSSRSATTFVGRWGQIEQKELTFRIGTTASAVSRAYPIELQFDYTDEDDNQNSRTAFVEITPTAGDQFEVESLTHDVPQGGEGTLLMNVTRTGETAVSDVTVTASTTAAAVYLGAESSRSSEMGLESWEPGQTRQLAFRAGTTESAVNRTYPVQLQFEYTDADNNQNSRNTQVEFRPTERDHFRIEAVRNDVPKNGMGTVTIDLTNTEERPLLDVVATISTTDSEVYIGSESSRSGTATLESVAPGQTRTLTYRVGASANAVNRSYPLDLSLDYTDAADNDNQQTEQVAFRPQPEPQFRVVDVHHDAPIGGSGRVAITMQNTGPVNATDASLTISSEVNAVYFGTGGSSEPVQAAGVTLEPPQTGTPTSMAFVGDWSAGENRTIYFRVGFDENAIQHPYTADLTVAYENEAGDGMPTRSTTIGIEPLPEPTFDLTGVDSSLHVGEEGNLVGTVTNDGNRTAEGIVLSVESSFQNINFYNTQYAIGALPPGESATFRFRVGVTEEAEHGPRLFELTARYRDPDNEVRTTDSRDLMVNIGSERKAFRIETSRGTLSPGQSGTLVLTLTNNRNETLRNIQAKLFTDDPLDSADDSAFISALDPGESSRITMDLSAAGSAMAKTYSVSLDFRYDNARGESRLSDTYRVAVTVQEGDSGINLPLVAGIVPIALVLGVLGWRFDVVRRLQSATASGGLLAWYPDVGILRRLRTWYDDRFN